MKPSTKEEWRVLLELLRLIRKATPAQRKELLRLWRESGIKIE